MDSKKSNLMIATMPTVDYDQHCPHCPHCNGGIYYGTGKTIGAGCSYIHMYYSAMQYSELINPEPIKSKIPWFRQFEKKRKVE